jgi:hypothetical protein
MRSYLRNSGAFKDVVESGSQLGADTFVEVHVTDLYGDFRQSAKPAAVLTMRLLFFNAEGMKTRRPFLQQNYARRLPLPQNTAAALVGGWNRALAQIMAEVATDLEAAGSSQAGH